MRRLVGSIVQLDRRLLQTTFHQACQHSNHRRLGTGDKTNKPNNNAVNIGQEYPPTNWNPPPTKRSFLGSDSHNPTIVVGSFIVFMVYFCLLREENEVDEKMKRSYHEQYGHEAAQLKKAYDYNIKHNLPTTEILDRLKEIGVPMPAGPPRPR